MAERRRRLSASLLRSVFRDRALRELEEPLSLCILARLATDGTLETADCRVLPTSGRRAEDPRPTLVSTYAAETLLRCDQRSGDDCAESQ